MKRTILHLDLDAFYCAVEEKSNPALEGIPFAVGGAADKRGVVASCSYAARIFGVRSAMPMKQAKRVCPDLVVVPPNFDAYRSHSEAVMQILYNLTPLVEQLSIDEAFVDVSGIREEGSTIAERLQMTIRNECGLPCSIGVASNKLLAKIANNIGKSQHHAPYPPCAIEVVPHGSEAAYLAPLPIRELWGIGGKTADQLHLLDIHTIGDIANQQRNFMMYHFGKHGFDMWRRAQGIDTRPVETEHEAKSYSKETTFERDTTDATELKRVLRNLSEQVGQRLRQAELSGTTIKIKLRWSDFTTITRQTTLPHPTDDSRLIAQTAQTLLEKNWSSAQPVRLIGVGVTNLENAIQQLKLWESEHSKRNRKLQHSIDELRDRFGNDVIKRAIDHQKDD